MTLRRVLSMSVRTSVDAGLVLQMWLTARMTDETTQFIAEYDRTRPVGGRRRERTGRTIESPVANALSWLPSVARGVTGRDGDLSGVDRRV